ncbi:MAG: hypothetical protein ACFBZ8_04120 [Opitutales bacterium]
MASENDPDSASLIAAFQRLGAPPEQARVMARQLRKRADQLAAERGLDRVQALD